MGQRLVIHRTCLLMGLKNQGKTLFLYTCVLKASESIENISPSESYNYEVLQLGEQNIGIWDIPGDMMWHKMRKYFYRNMNFDMVIYVIRMDDKPRHQKASKSEVTGRDASKPLHRLYKFYEPIVESRKDLHFLMNEPEMKDITLVILLNQKIEDSENETLEKKRKQQMKMINFNELPQPNKEAYMVDVSNWKKVEEVLEKIFKTKNESQSSSQQKRKTPQEQQNSWKVRFKSN